MNPPKISIIAPIYGVEKYIKRFAKSVFSVDYDNIEYVFVNDCTKDKSIQLLEATVESFPLRKPFVSIINHETNKGLAGARLTGINASSGDYIWLVDSDDYINKTAIKEAIPYMNKNVDLICSNFYRITSEGIKNVYIKEPSVNTIITSYTSPSVWKFFIKRSLIFNNNIFPIQGVNFSEDHVLMARLCLKAETIVYLPNSFFYYYDCTNMGSYMRNISRNSIENYVEDGIIVYDYYKKEGADSDYNAPLVYMLSSRFVKLLKVDINHPQLKQLLDRIYSLNKMYGILLKCLYRSPRLVKIMNSLFFLMNCKR